jgi:hypothetical protein
MGPNQFFADNFFKVLTFLEEFVTKSSLHLLNQHNILYFKCYIFYIYIKTLAHKRGIFLSFGCKAVQYFRKCVF